MGYLDGKGKFDSKKWIRKNTVTGVDKSSVKQGKDINESIGGYSRIKKPRDLSRMEGLHDMRHMKEMIKYASLLYQDMEEEGFEGAEIYDFLFYKINNTNL